MKVADKIEFNLQKFVESRIIQIESNSKIPFDSMSLMT